MPGEKELNPKDTGMCPHGNFPDSCEQCKTESSTAKEREGGIDQEFYSDSSRFFNSEKNSLEESARAATSDGDREEYSEMADRRGELGGQLGALASPDRIDRIVEREGLKEKYGKDAKAVYVAESMGDLAGVLSQLPEFQRRLNEKDDVLDEQTLEEAIARQKTAKELFMKAGEKVFGSEDDDAKSAADIQKVISDYGDFMNLRGKYDNAPVENAGALTGAASGVMESWSRNEFPTDADEQKKMLDNLIGDLGHDISSYNWQKYEGNYQSMPEEMKWHIAEGNRFLYRLQKIRDSI